MSKQKTETQKQELIKKYHALIANGVGKKDACVRLRINYSTMHHWLRSQKASIIVHKAEKARPKTILRKKGEGSTGKVAMVFGSPSDIAETMKGLGL